MIKQPDTITHEGRHAVELASRKFRIQECQLGTYGNSWGSKNPWRAAFIWDQYSYRIHPEDLQAWAATQKRDVGPDAQQEFEDEINAAFKNLGREDRDDLFRRGMEVINNGAKVSEASKLEAAHAAVKIARQEIAEQRKLLESMNRQLCDKDAEIMLLRTQVKNMNKDKLLKIHTTCVNEEDNSGESLMITTKVYSNGDDIVKRKDGNIDGIYFYQEITLQSYANSASFNLGSITLTPTILREIANELEQSINSVL